MNLQRKNNKREFYGLVSLNIKDNLQNNRATFLTTYMFDNALSQIIVERIFLYQVLFMGRNFNVLSPRKKKFQRNMDKNYNVNT